MESARAEAWTKVADADFRHRIAVDRKIRAFDRDPAPFDGVKRLHRCDPRA
jgi:hypothetical protein